MASHSTVADRIRAALAEYLKRSPATIKAEQLLRDDLGLDSMATIELLFRIEEAFDLQIPDEDLHRMTTVGDVIGYVERKVSPALPSRKPKRPGSKEPRTGPPKAATTKKAK